MNIGIVGLGLIGGTYAKSLRAYPYTLYGIDIDQDTLDFAKENNIVDITSSTPKDVLQELDVVFMCLYPDATINFIRKHINHFKRGAIISDVVGIKRDLINSLDIFFDDDLEFVFGHPIAGKETIGIKHSDKSIFTNANYVITPTQKNKEEALSVIETLAKQMGFKHVSRISDVEHDEIIGFTSQLTHMIAIALINSDQEKYDTSKFIGDSYRDLTRIAHINEKLWAELLLKNKDFLLRHVDRFEQHLDELKSALNNKDKDKIMKLMRIATERREKLK